MFSKPFNLILVYVVTVFNMIVLVSPIMAGLLPFVDFKRHVISIDYDIYQKIEIMVFILLFLVSFFMLFYMFLDFLFGFSVRSSLKNCVRHEKVKDYDFLSGIFEQNKKKFGEKNVRLYVKNSDEINAYAVSSFSRRAVVLTRGIINHYLVECPDSKQFLNALRSIMGHEMSHLINKDFLPTFLIMVNQKVTNFVSRILAIIFTISARIFSFTPYGGRIISGIITDIYSFIDFLITSFNRYVVYNLYQFLRKFVSRNIEYRCDMQSAQAFGGQNMALALSMLGEGGYFTIFSTHPSTARRIKKVQEIKIKERTISPRFVDSLANYFSLIFLVFTCLYFAKKAKVDLMLREYLRDHSVLNAKISMLWQLFIKFYHSFF